MARFIPAGAGEHPFGGCVAVASNGSSPAGAGNTDIARSGYHGVPVHPRGRGGTRDRHGLQSRPSRFIPAGAGNTFEDRFEREHDAGSFPAGAGNNV